MIEAPYEREPLQRILCRTPKGNDAYFDVRVGTADYNNIISCCTEDEYGTRELDLGDGVAFDVGAHIGGVAITLAIDNPGARIYAIEPVPPNIALLRQNIANNDLEDRITVLEGAVGAPGQTEATVSWDFSGGPNEESAVHHRYIGNMANIPYLTSRQHPTTAYDMATLAILGNYDIAFMKIDCEGGEYALFAGGPIGAIGALRGEYHSSWYRLVGLLEATHEVVQLNGSTATFGGFRALRKGSVGD